MSTTATSQRGVALLTILLLVVSITVVAGAMLASQKIAIRRSGLLFNQNQLLQDIDAAQQLATTIIRADAELNDTDSPLDIWAQSIPPYRLGSHSITIELRDEASRFNINNLYHNSEVDTAALAVLQKLLTQLNLDSDIAVAILDWQDGDNEVYNDGGDEGAVYTQGNSLAANTLPNQPFVSVEQLLEVRGVTTDMYRILQPYLTAVPYYLPINVNTANPELLAALVDGVELEQIQSLAFFQDRQVVESIDSLWQQPPLNSLSEEQRNAVTPLIAVDSQAFSALVTATDSDQETAKQRFATLLISKVANENNPSNSVNTETDANNSTNAADNSGDNTKVVKIISQRLWSFRPNF